MGAFLHNHRTFTLIQYFNTLLLLKCLLFPFRTGSVQGQSLHSPFPVSLAAFILEHFHTLSFSLLAKIGDAVSSENHI
jgi:hypothetical protein